MPIFICLIVAKICSIHFGEDSFTSQYNEADYSSFERILKYDALPTLFLPQEAIVYRVANIDENNCIREDYGIASVIIDNTQNQHLEPLEQVEGCIVEYQELQSLPIQNEDSVLTEPEPEPELIIDDRYKHITSFRQLEILKTRNDKMLKELVKLERNVVALKNKVKTKVYECGKKNVEYNKLLKTLHNLESGSMSVAEQKTILSKVFSESQIKILSGKKKIYWSHDDMAVAYTLRHISSKRCYMYLSKNLNIPLPGLSSIKRWQALKKNELMSEEAKSKDEKEYPSDSI